MCRFDSNLGRLLLKYQSPKYLFNQLQLIKGNSFPFDRKFKKAREAWIMAGFSVGYEELRRVKLEIKTNEMEDSPCDNRMKVNNQTVDYQITELLDPERKRDKEYKTWIKNGRPPELKPCIPIEFDKARELIKNAISEKRQISVANKTNLLIYVNFWKDKLSASKLHEEFIALDIKPFSEVWLFMSAVRDGGFAGSYAIAQLLPNNSGYHIYEIEES